MIHKFFSDIYVDAVLYISFLAFILLNFQISVVNMAVLILIIISLILWIVSRIQLGNAYSVEPKASKLVTGGIYSKIRHPIYFFTFIANVGIIFLLGNRWLYLLVPLIFALQFYRARKESALLLEKFGQDYINYKKKTWF